MRHVFGLGLALICAQSLAAETTPTTPNSDLLNLELNALEAMPEGCRLTFVADNQLPADIDRLVLETVLFDPAGQVTQMTMLDFGAIPAQRSRVRQFALTPTPCTGLGQILFNGVQSCEGAGASPSACEAALTVSSRTDIEVAR